MGAYRYKADMIDIEPSCVRTILVPDTFTFRDLSLALNAAFDWWEGHEHIIGVVMNPGKDDVLIITDYGDEFGLDRYRDEDTLLSEYRGKTIQYTYDLGDEWRHLVTFEGEVPDYDLPYPTLESFEGRSPPEDCGGPDGYTDLLRILADPKDPEHAEMAAWAEWIGFGKPVSEEINYNLSKVDGSEPGDEDSGMYWSAEPGMFPDGPDVLPGDSFWDDADRYRGVDPGRTIPIACDNPWPTFKTLTEEQLEWYLSWRSACDRGDVKPTSRGYVWLYLAELADREDWRSATERMEDLIHAFQEADLKVLVRKTIIDIKNAHRPDDPIAEASGRFDWFDAQRYLSEVPLPELPREEVATLIRVNGKYCEGREEETAGIIGYSLKAMDAYCRSAYGKDIHDAMYGPKWVRYYAWLPSRRPRSFLRRTDGYIAIYCIATCAIARMWRIDHPRGGPQVKPSIDKEFVDLIDRAVKDCVAGKPFDPDNYRRWERPAKGPGRTVRSAVPDIREHVDHEGHRSETRTLSAMDPESGMPIALNLLFPVEECGGLGPPGFCNPCQRHGS